MHFITFLKSSGVIVDYRDDTSEPPYWTEATLRAAVSKDRELAENDIETKSFETLPPQNSSFVAPLIPRRHAYDASSNMLKNNPNYVPPPVERRWGLESVMSCLTLAEKSKFVNNLTPSIVTAKAEFREPRNQADTTEILQFLVDSGDISPASMAKILA
jgi:hypothetical protein